MAIIEYEDEIKELVNRDNHNDFIYDFLSIYDKISKATITKLRKGTNNLAKNTGEVYLKNKLYFKYAADDVFGSFSQVENYVSGISSKPRYIIVTDYNRLLAKDTKTKDSLDIEFTQLPKYFEFFLAWNGIEKADFEKENPADIKAAEYFARIYDQLLEDNESVSRHGFNLFLIRLLFCLFAEDTGIFKDNSFTDFLKMMTSDDGSDMNKRISELFSFLDKKVRSGSEPAYLLEFPYVNGQLFTDIHEEITFSKKTRKSIIDAGELIGWEKVNPDILGSMLQAVATEDKRSHLGMHYTSVPNILKVIKPLFLNGLRDEFNKSKGDEKKLNRLYDRIGKIKFMDPACGSGNFLIIAYKELRQLEIDIIKELNAMGIATMYVPSVTLSQFYGIEIEDFATDVTRLSLWIAEHQMNKKLESEIDNAVRPTLPLHQAGSIVCGNALRLNWKDLIFNYEKDEVYLFGNPPYLGYSLQSSDQKNDLKNIFNNKVNYKRLDYISGWFYLASEYITNTNAKFAFVTTNSINQGEQVSILWPIILKSSQIIFSYSSFKWENNAKNNAGVSVSIIGMSDKNKKEEKFIFLKNGYRKVGNISPYLIEGDSTIVEKSRKSIFSLPKICNGSRPVDDGNFILSEKEKNIIESEFPSSKKVIKKMIGSKEFINGNYRYALWLSDSNYKEYIDIPLIREKIAKIRRFREQGGQSARSVAEMPWAFFLRKEFQNNLDKFEKSNNKHMINILIPRVSSENRVYVPMGIEDSNVIISDSAMAIYNAPLWLMGFLESKMHMIWLKSFGGKLENRLRYSGDLVYNTFPVPKISSIKKEEIEELVLDILDIREEESGNISELYGSPLSQKNRTPMNQKLLKAHEKLDLYIESLYKSTEFHNDDERLSYLLGMYNKKIKG